MPTFAQTPVGENTMSSVCIVERSQELVRNRPRPITFRVIEEGTGISPRWLTDFTNGRITEPSAQRIQKLYEFLTGQPLIK
jgi:hypothetical protein